VPMTHCLACGGPVVVDPRGICPVGHDVGTQGARVEQAMGSSTAHPDEPEPWIGMVVLEDPQSSTAGADPEGIELASAGSAPTPRPARPVAAPRGGARRTEEPIDSEALLQELHALSEFAADLGGAAGDTPAPPRSASAPTAAPGVGSTPAGTAPADVGAAPDPSSSRGPGAGAPDPDPVPVPDELDLTALDLDALDELWSVADASPAAPVAPASRRPTTGPGPLAPSQDETVPLPQPGAATPRTDGWADLPALDELQALEAAVHSLRSPEAPFDAADDGGASVPPPAAPPGPTVTSPDAAVPPPPMDHAGAAPAHRTPPDPPTGDAVDDGRHDTVAETTSDGPAAPGDPEAPSPPQPGGMLDIGNFTAKGRKVGRGAGGGGAAGGGRRRRFGR
jgi:hypothetical protein